MRICDILLSNFLTWKRTALNLRDLKLQWFMCYKVIYVDFDKKLSLGTSFDCKIAREEALIKPSWFQKMNVKSSLTIQLHPLIICLDFRCWLITVFWRLQFWDFDKPCIIIVCQEWIFFLQLQNKFLEKNIRVKG